MASRDRELIYTDPMGLAYVDMQIASVGDPEKLESIQLLIDSGALISVVPAELLDRLSIKPIAEQVFQLADGTKIRRKKGGALFRYKDAVGVSDVVFGEPGAANLCGVLTLEALGLSLDPNKRELNPLPMLLVGMLPVRD